MAFTLTKHAEQQANAKRFPLAAVLAAASRPEVTYSSGPKYPGQMRHIAGGIVAVVDPRSRRIITCYANVVETPLRDDQRARGERIRRRR
jgi:hypothetical protein